MLLQGGLTVGHRTHNPKIGGSIPPPALIVQRGVSKESITQQHTAGTFDRPLSSYDRYFSNVPYFLNRDARKYSNMADFGVFVAENRWDIRGKCPIFLQIRLLYGRKHRTKNFKQRP